MKIAFLISSLSAGGAERVASLLCNRWADLGHEIHVLTYQDADTVPYYDLSGDIRQHHLDVARDSAGAVRFLRNNLQKIGRIRRTLKGVQPDVVVSFLTDVNILAILAARSLGLPVVVSERTHPVAHRLGRLQQGLRKAVYPYASKLVVQTKAFADWYAENLKIESAVMPNPIPQAGRARGASKGARRRLVAIGRLSQEKGYDLLLSAFSTLAGEHDDWDLVIFGEGCDRAILEAQVEDSGLGARVSMPGKTRDVFGELERSDLYVHPSRYEGFPNALAEALSAGLCCVATACPGGAAELLGNGRYGLIARTEDASDLRRALDRAMGDDALRGEFARTAPQAVRDYSVEKVADDWLALIQDVRSK